MSNKKNYNKISTDKVKNESENLDAVVEESKVDTPVEPVIENKIGVVCNCEKLNVRSKPTTKSDVVCVIPKGTEVEINKDKSTKAFYSVVSKSDTEGFTGFCMKQYISIKE